jgi:hypothetical protein
MSGSYRRSEKGNRVPVPASAPHRTLMRTLIVKRQTTPQSGLLTFFRVPGLGQSTIGRVSWLAVWRLARPVRGGTTHVLRRAHHRRGACPETPDWLSAASTRLRTLLPAYATGRVTGARAPVSARLGGGAAHRNRWRCVPHGEDGGACHAVTCSPRDHFFTIAYQQVGWGGASYITKRMQATVDSVRSCLSSSSLIPASLASW